MSVTACLSHKEDVDGVLSAVLIKAAFNADTIVLSDYQNVIPNLDRFSSADLLPKLNQIFVSDLGLSKKNESEFVEILRKIVSAKTKVAYIDHHDLRGDTAAQLKK